MAVMARILYNSIQFLRRWGGYGFYSLASASKLHGLASERNAKSRYKDVSTHNSHDLMVIIISQNARSRIENTFVVVTLCNRLGDLTSPLACLSSRLFSHLRLASSTSSATSSFDITAFLIRTLSVRSSPGQPAFIIHMSWVQYLDWV